MLTKLLYYSCEFDVIGKRYNTLNVNRRPTADDDGEDVVKFNERNKKINAKINIMIFSVQRNTFARHIVRESRRVRTLGGYGR